MAKKKAPRSTSKHTPPFTWILMGICLLLSLVAFYLLLSQPCANSGSCIKDLSGNYREEKQTGEFMGATVQSPVLSYDIESTQVLGDTTGKQKRIEIDLKNQKLYAFEENDVIYEFPISSGKWGKTPTGDFRIWVKLRYTRMTGGNRALGTYYDLPNVPYTMFFYNDEIPKSRGYGIHGAYWHNNFGQPMSHGCINMREEDVAKIYQWASPTSTGSMTYATEEDLGTPIKIYGESSDQ